MKDLNFDNIISAICTSWSLHGAHFESIEERHDEMLMYLKKNYNIPDEEVLSEQIYSILYTFGD